MLKIPIWINLSILRVRNHSHSEKEAAYRRAFSNHEIQFWGTPKEPLEEVGAGRRFQEGWLGPWTGDCQELLEASWLVGCFIVEQSHLSHFSSQCPRLQTEMMSVLTYFFEAAWYCGIVAVSNNYSGLGRTPRSTYSHCYQKICRLYQAVQKIIVAIALSAVINFIHPVVVLKFAGLELQTRNRYDLYTSRDSITTPLTVRERNAILKIVSTFSTNVESGSALAQPCQARQTCPSERPTKNITAF